MSELSVFKKGETHSKQARQGRMEELVTEVCAQLLSGGQLEDQLEGEQSRNSDAEFALKQRLVIKHLVKKFLENTGKTIKTLNASGGSDREENISDKDTTPSKTCNEGQNKLKISKENEKMEISITSQTTADEKKEVKPSYVIQEEATESKNNIKTVPEEEDRKNITYRYELSDTGIMDDGIVLKTESSYDFDKKSKEIGLAAEEEEEIKRLIFIAESNNSTVAVKTEKEVDRLYEENNNQSTRQCRECKSESGLCQSTDTIKTGSYVGAGPGEPIKVHVSAESEIPTILKDKKGPFYVRHNRMRIPLKYYQDNLLNHKWNPTKVLYELCVQCNWCGPEFRLLDFSKSEGFWYSVKVNNLNFVSYRKSRCKKQAKHLASARFFRFLGYQYKYEVLSRAERRRRNAEPPWSEKYINYDSSSLAREEERLGLVYDYDLGEPEAYFDSFCDNKRKRSRSNESRSSKVRRISSPESGHQISKMRSDNRSRSRRDTSLEHLERSTKMINDDREERSRSRRDTSLGHFERSTKMISDDREERSGSRRDTSLERLERNTKLHSDQKRKEHRKPRLVHERISVTHVYDRDSSSSSRCSRDNESARKRH